MFSLLCLDRRHNPEVCHSSSELGEAGLGTDRVDSESAGGLLDLRNPPFKRAKE